MAQYQSIRVAKSDGITWEQAVDAFNEAFKSQRDDMAALSKFSSNTVGVIRKVDGIYVRSRAGLGHCNYLVSDQESDVTKGSTQLLNPDGSFYWSKLAQQSCPSCGAVWRSMSAKTRFCPECGEEL